MAATTVTITLAENGTISINGPLTNKLLCWGLLAAASDLVRTYNPAEKPLIEVPEFVTPRDLRAVERPDEG